MMPEPKVLIHLSVHLNGHRKSRNSSTRINTILISNRAIAVMMQKPMPLPGSPIPEPANTSSDLPLISVLSATRIWMIHRETPLPSNGSWQTATNMVSFSAILLINPILQESLMSHGTTAMLVKMWHRKSTIKEFAWRNIWKYSNKYKKLFLGFTFILENPDTAFLPYLDFLLKYTCYLFCLCLYSMIALISASLISVTSMICSKE